MSYSPSIQSISWNSTALTVTSFTFNDGQAFSPWIDHSLGHKSVFRKRSDLVITTSLNRFHPFALPDWTQAPVCSVELLAFIHFAPPSHDKPSIGNSTLTLNNQDIACFHRTMYGRWFGGGGGADDGDYWPTLVFCPVSLDNRSSCNRIRDHEASFTFGMPAGSNWWKDTFKPHRKSRLDVSKNVSIV